MSPRPRGPRRPQCGVTCTASAYSELGSTAFEQGATEVNDVTVCRQSCLVPSLSTSQVQETRLRTTLLEAGTWPGGSNGKMMASSGGLSGVEKSVLGSWGQG